MRNNKSPKSDYKFKLSLLLGHLRKRGIALILIDKNHFRIFFLLLFPFGDLFRDEFESLLLEFLSFFAYPFAADGRDCGV